MQGESKRGRPAPQNKQAGRAGKEHTPAIIRRGKAGCKGKTDERDIESQPDPLAASGVNRPS
jgi:hypothetical protein